MPENDHLDRQLADARTQLLQSIDIAELSGVQARAGQLRRRRRTVASALALTLLALGTGTALWPDSATVPAPTASQLSPSPSPSPSGWRAGDLAVLALDASVLDLPGDLYDVQFTDPKTGYALAQQCDDDETCVVTFAASTDGGHTWHLGDQPPVPQSAPADLPRLHPVGATGIALVSSDAIYLARTPGGDDPVRWEQVATAGADSAVEAIGAGPLYLRPTAGDDCVPGTVKAWTPAGVPVTLRRQPPIQACRVAPARAGDGAWWVSGRANGSPAVAVSRDDGRSWSMTALPSGPAGSAQAWAELAIRGPEVYASVVSPDSLAGAVRVEAVYRSAGGGPFAAYARDLGVIRGALVPLFDGRFVAANGALLVSRGPDTPLAAAGTGLPGVGSIEKTPGVWVAHDVFGNRWAAISTDGLTWQKINLH